MMYLCTIYPLKNRSKYVEYFISTYSLQNVIHFYEIFKMERSASIPRIPMRIKNKFESTP